MNQKQQLVDLLNSINRYDHVPSCMGGEMEMVDGGDYIKVTDLAKILGVMYYCGKFSNTGYNDNQKKLPLLPQ